MRREVRCLTWSWEYFLPSIGWSVAMFMAPLAIAALVIPITLLAVIICRLSVRGQRCRCCSNDWAGPGNDEQPVRRRHRRHSGDRDLHQYRPSDTVATRALIAGEATSILADDGRGSLSVRTRGHKIERLLGHDLAPIGQKQSHPDAPPQANQPPMIAERSRRQQAGQRLFVRQARRRICSSSNRSKWWTCRSVSPFPSVYQSTEISIAASESSVTRETRQVAVSSRPPS